MSEPNDQVDAMDMGPLDPREQAFYAALAREATGATATEVSAEDLAMVEAVLALHHMHGQAHGHAHGHDADGHAHAAVPELAPVLELGAGRRSGARWAVAVLAVAAALVLSWMVLTPEPSPRGSQGTWIAEHDRRALEEGDALPLAAWLVAQGEACVQENDGASACAREGAVVRLHPSGDRRVALEVRDGAVTIDGALEVRTPAGSLLGIESSRFEVRVSAYAGVVEVEVVQGSLQLREPDGSRALEAGDHVRLGEAVARAPEPEPEPTEEVLEDPQTPPTRVPARPSGRSSKPGSGAPEPGAPEPGALLVQARTRLGEGDKSGAAKAYTTLIEAHPATAEAQAARVSLGQLRLSAGRHKAALVLFNRYLERGGPLAEEALWGKVRATAGLGRGKALEAAVAELVRRFPSSVYRVRAQELLAR